MARISVLLCAQMDFFKHIAFLISFKEEVAQMPKKYGIDLFPSTEIMETWSTRANSIFSHWSSQFKQRLLLLPVSLNFIQAPNEWPHVTVISSHTNQSEANFKALGARGQNPISISRTTNRESQREKTHQKEEKKDVLHQ